MTLVDFARTMTQTVRSSDPSRARATPWRSTRLIVLGFVLTRVVVVLLVLNPDTYPHGVSMAWDRDVLYRSWSSQVLEEGEIPYADTHIEYPPGALPFLVLPGVVGTDHDTYRLVFVLMMVAVDLLGLVASIRMAKRWQSPATPWLWVVLVGLLGPLAYARFDLVPAVMTAWAIERAAYVRWAQAGAWISAGGIAKIYPFLLLPLMFISAPRRTKFTWGVVALLVAGLLPTLAVLDEVWRDVGGYHLTRGIHVESFAGSILFIASKQGVSSVLSFGSGALHFTGGFAEWLRFICDVGVLVAMAAGIYIASKLRRGDVKALSAAMLGTLTLAMVASPVLSPQFILWIVPLGVAAVAAEAGRTIPLLLLGITVTTVVIFPFLYTELSTAEPLPVILLWGRNLALLWLGLSVLRRAWHARVPAVGG